MKVKEYTDFDLPTQHLASDEHYVMPPALTEAEIARRRANPPTTTKAEGQYYGAATTASVWRMIETPEEKEFAVSTFAVAVMGAGGYNIADAKNNLFDVMRSRLKLSRHQVDGTGRGPNGEELMLEAIDALDELAVASGWLINAIQEGRHDLPFYRRMVGKKAGETALVLASVNLGDALIDATPAQAQTWKREEGLRLMGSAHILKNTLQMPASLAQLSDPYGKLSGYIHDNAPKSVALSLMEAHKSHAMPR